MIFRIAKDRTAPKLLYQCLGSSGCPIDLTGASSVKFSLVKQDRLSTIIQNKKTALLSTHTDYPASQGWIEYTFDTDDTEFVEFYYGRFDITKDGIEAAYPNQFEKLEIYVERSGIDYFQENGGTLIERPLSFDLLIGTNEIRIPRESPFPFNVSDSVKIKDDNSPDFSTTISSIIDIEAEEDKFINPLPVAYQTGGTNIMWAQYFKINKSYDYLVSKIKMLLQTVGNCGQTEILICEAALDGSGNPIYPDLNKIKATTGMFDLPHSFPSISWLYVNFASNTTLESGKIYTICIKAEFWALNVFGSGANDYPDGKLVCNNNWVTGWDNPSAWICLGSPACQDDIGFIIIGDYKKITLGDNASEDYTVSQNAKIVK